MTLKNCSSKKLNPFINMLLFTFKKNLGFTGIATLISFIFSPVFLWRKAIEWLEYEEIRIYDLMDEFDFLANALAIGCCAFAIVLLVINFNFLNNRKGNDAFHSLPLTRTELFFARFIPSFVCSLIPLTVSYAGFMAVSALPGITADIPFIFPAYGYTVLMILFLCAFSCVFIMATGCVFDTVVSLGAVNLGVPIAVMLIGNMCHNRLFGFPGYSYETEAFVYGTPFGYAIHNLNKYVYLYGEAGYVYNQGSTQNPFVFWKILIIFALTVLLFALNIFLYNRRRSERAGEAYAFRFLPDFIAVIIGFIGYYVFATIFNIGEGLFYIIMGVIGAALAILVYNVISNRGFKKIKNALILFGVSIALTLIINVGIEIDIFGFETYVPSNDSIQSATINAIKETTVEGEDIKYITDFHKTVVSDKKNWSQGGEGDEMDWVHISYTLKNGKTVERNYFILAKVGAEEKAEIVKKCVVPSTKKDFEELESDTFKLEFTFPESDSRGTVYLNRNQAQRVIDTYCEDLLKADAKKLTASHDYAYLYVKGPKEDGYFFEIPYRDDFDGIKSLFAEIEATADKGDIEILGEY